MGTLKPGVTYVYEHVDGITYAREFNAPAKDRFEIGRTLEKQSLIDNLRNQKLWEDIHRAAETNPVLQEALNRVKVTYELSKKDGEK